MSMIFACVLSTMIWVCQTEGMLVSNLMPGIDYRIAGNFRWVRFFAIFTDRPASAKIKTAKKWTKMEIDDVITCVVEYPCERDGSLQSVCPLNGRCEEEPASYCTKYQRNRKRRSEDIASTGRGVVRSSRIPRKYKPRKFLLKSQDAFPRKFAPAKISRYMVSINDTQCS